jgi:nicotinamidase-related amidase
VTRAARTVLIALHYQNDVIHPKGAIKLGIAESDDVARKRLVEKAGQLLAGARALEVPVVHVRTARPADPRTFPVNAPIFRNVVAIGACIDGQWGSDFFDELGPTPGETVVVHNRVNGFYDSMLETRLRELGATHLVLAGVATNSCVEHTARHAADMGYVVTVAHDACSAARPEVHEAALFNIGLVGTVSTVEDVIGRGFA